MIKGGCRYVAGAETTTEADSAFIHKVHHNQVRGITVESHLLSKRIRTPLRLSLPIDPRDCEGEASHLPSSALTIRHQL